MANRRPSTGDTKKAKKQKEENFKEEYNIIFNQLEEVPDHEPPSTWKDSLMESFSSKDLDALAQPISEATSSLQDPQDIINLATFLHHRDQLHKQAQRTSGCM